MCANVKKQKMAAENHVTKVGENNTRALWRHGVNIVSDLFTIVVNFALGVINALNLPCQIK